MILARHTMVIQPALAACHQLRDVLQHGAGCKTAKAMNECVWQLQQREQGFGVG